MSSQGSSHLFVLTKYLSTFFFVSFPLKSIQYELFEKIKKLSLQLVMFY